MTYREISQRFHKEFDGAYFSANDGDAGTEELLAFIFDLVNEPDEPIQDTKSAGMSFLPLALAEAA